jgi:hypothetical protein
MWLCHCECGTFKQVAGLNLRLGNTQSCGCWSREITAVVSRPSHRGYHKWGGRGIKVCERWNNSFADFLADMGQRPTHEHSLDRYPDKDGHYEPGNCRWATAWEQANNTRQNVLVAVEGKELPLRIALKRYGVTKSAYYQRLRRGWSQQRALTTPLRRVRS